jgi:uncharacterized protein YqeY
MIKENISKEMIIALKNKESEKLLILRTMLSKIKDKEINSRDLTKEVTQTLADSEVIAVLKQMIKQRQDSIELYKKGDRLELANKEQFEIDIILQFMPKQLNAQETKDVVLKAIAEVKPANAKEIGKVIAYLKANFGANIDMAVASNIAKENLQ